MIRPFKYSFFLASSLLPLAASPVQRMPNPAPQADPEVNPGLQSASLPEHTEEDLEVGWEPLAPLKGVEGRFQPMVQEQDAGLVPSQPFVAMAPCLAELNRLSYDRAQDPAPVSNVELVSGQADPTSGKARVFWTLHDLKNTSGFLGSEHYAGFVATQRENNTVVICFHGTVSWSDWFGNLFASATPMNSHAQENQVGWFDWIGSSITPDRAPYPAGHQFGKAHGRYLAMADACGNQIMAHVDSYLDILTGEEKAQTKFYVTGHNQGAAVAQIAVAQLCDHLQQRYEAFNNDEANRVHAWLLSTPPSLDDSGAAFVNRKVGMRNILVQNVALDQLPQAADEPPALGFKAAGTFAVQSHWDTLRKRSQEYQAQLSELWRAGKYTKFVQSLVPANPFRSSASTAHRMRTCGPKDPPMDPNEVLRDITWALQNARDREQEELRQRKLTQDQAAEGMTLVQ